MDDDLSLKKVSTVELAEDEFFTNNAPPKVLASTISSVKEFIHIQSTKNRRVVLITSGGTTVPLENQTVRFIDNFSAGTRGATSAEYFLKNGYAVVFLHRKFALLPYSRHYSHSTNCFLDFMELDETGKVIVRDEYQTEMRDVFREYRKAQTEYSLLSIPFTTISEYLWFLRDIAHTMQLLGSQTMFYLAAAVSDFFIPSERMSEHKIQSGDLDSANHSKGKKLVVDLDPVPKFLKRLVDGWAPDAMIVSFKLETDPSLLIPKAKQALERYSHDLVIGNLLNTRAREVVLVSAGKEHWVRLAEDEMSSGSEAAESKEIEALIVPEVIKLHDTMIKKGNIR